MNEHEISIHVNNKSQLQVVQPEFTTGKYKVKLRERTLSMEEGGGGFFQKIFHGLSQNL